MLKTSKTSFLSGWVSFSGQVCCKIKPCKGFKWSTSLTSQISTKRIHSHLPRIKLFFMHELQAPPMAAPPKNTFQSLFGIHTRGKWDCKNTDSSLWLVRLDLQRSAKLEKESWECLTFE